MSRGYGLAKLHHSIMKMDALMDYNAVVDICNQLKLPVVKPKGKSSWKIEDATSEMLKSIPPDQELHLQKGLSYYLSLNK
jgi:hypothetical protein